GLDAPRHPVRSDPNRSPDMWLAQPAHPYDDPKAPFEWAWRRGPPRVDLQREPVGVEVVAGPDDVVSHLPRQHGYLPRGECGTDYDPNVPESCPHCPRFRALVPWLPLWPAGTVDRVLVWWWRHRRARQAPVETRPLGGLGPQGRGSGRHRPDTPADQP